MKCPKCGFDQTDHHTECLHCGIVFEKYRKFQSATSGAKTIDPETDGRITWITSIFFYIKADTNPLIFVSRILFFAVMVIWGLKFIVTPLETNYTGQSIWHLINLPFHEAGHIIFRPFGRLMTSLGGSLGQLLIPMICLTTFLIKTRDTFAASFALWWFGQNFMDLAPYINDARSLSLPLLGGNTGRTSPYGFHDWEFILKQTGLIRYDHALANFSYKFGTIIMIISFLWGGYILFKYYQNLNVKTSLPLD
jgi:hypothetical protein